MEEDVDVGKTVSTKCFYCTCNTVEPAFYGTYH